MILYLNKNINENNNTPFRSRFNYTSLEMNNNNNPLNNGSFGLGMNNSNEINSNNLNNNQYMTKNINSMNIKPNLEDNNNINTNLNINNLNKYNNNFDGNDIDNQYGIQSQTSNKPQGNYFQTSLSSNTSGMIMPETNFTGYKFNDKVGGIANKYMNNNTGLGLGSGGSLLAHKYGGSVTNSMSVHNDNSNSEKFVMSGAKNNEYNNIEEEYPRTLAQPQSQIVRK